MALTQDAEGHVRLTDFGLSREMAADEEIAFSFVGTTDYLAPDIIRQQVAPPNVSFFVVVWPQFVLCVVACFLGGNQIGWFGLSPTADGQSYRLLRDYGRGMARK